MKRAAIAVLSALLILFMVFVPNYVQKQVDQDIYLQWMSGKRGWEGVLQLWHVTSFLTASGTDGSAWLSARAREFEKRNFGLFIEIKSMSILEANNRLEKGESPDLWSFPSGFSPGALTPLAAKDVPELLPGLLKSGREHGEQLALPYMMSGYMLLGNTDLLESRDVQLPDTSEYSTEKWDKETLTTAAKAATFEKKIGKRTTNFVGFTYAAGQRMGIAALIDRLPTLAAGEYAASEERFLSANAALCAGTLGTMGTLERMDEAGKGFSYFAEPAGNFTDCVQYIAICNGIEEERQSNAQHFMLWLLSEKAQKQLPKHGALGVNAVAAAASANAPDEYTVPVKKLAVLLLDPVVPNAFSWGAQRKRLEELAEPAIHGDAGAIAKFNNIMLE